MAEAFKQIGWRPASRYTKRAVFLRRPSTGEMQRVDAIKKRGPNLWVTLSDGRSFLVDRDRAFYARTVKESS